MSFSHAGGTYTTDHSIPVSAFSTGDVLVLTSASSLSRISETWPTGGKYCGIALGSSLQSISNKVPYLIPNDDTTFWASIDTTLTSELTPGQQCDVIYGAGNGRYYVTSSANSARAVIVKGTKEVDQSTESRALVRLLTSGAQSVFE